ncbi:MAG: HAMP domain-containing protein, partial [Clostridiaceae bacterium]|nr:HAMP domain-containing protein [Clostridiaceae bacterium]
NFISNKKIGIKLILFISTAFITTIAITVAVSLFQFNNYNDKVSEGQALMGAEGLVSKLDEMKSQAMKYADIIAHNSDIVLAIEARDTKALYDLTNALSEYAETDFISITNENGVLLTTTLQGINNGEILTNQSNIQEALKGNHSADLESGYGIELMACAGVPVYNSQKTLVGVVSTGFRLDKEELMDAIKNTYSTDVTLFAGDVRLNTTIILDGKRVIGTKLDPAIAEKVINRKEQYIGSAQILGLPYITAYEPLLDSKKQVVGVAFAGHKLEEAVAVRNNIINIVLMVALSLTIVLIFFLNVYIKKCIVSPLNKLIQISNSLAEGDIDVSVTSRSKDEIGELITSFGIMIDNIREQVYAVEKLGKGDLTANIKPKSSKDILSNSIVEVIQKLTDLKKESDTLTASAVQGRLQVRGDTGKFTGAYKEILEGVNNTLDAVIEPINEASDVLKELSEGNLSVSVGGNYKGDHAIIKESLNKTILRLSEYISEIAYVLTQMSEGNMDIDLKGDYKGDFVQIKNSLNMIIKSFNRILGDLNAAAYQVTAGSRQVSDASTSLSQGSAEQASSIQELNASMEEISSQTKKNAINANEANELALAAKNAAIEGNKHMQEMLTSMEEINNASTNISKIIKVIDEIAFQTNILALNAAVEAARAGQYGKGFAVVAEEVRNLAAKSLEAAKETTSLIEGSISKVEAGTRTANNTADSLKHIVDNILKVSGIINSIADASNNQATGISQINLGINQVSQVTQTNSAISEESAAASEELASQAELLKQMVENFKIKSHNNAQRIEDINPEIISMV